VVDGLNALVERHPRWGFWKMFHALRLEGRRWNHKRVWRAYCAMKLNQKRRAKRRLPDRPRVPLAVPSEPNHTWSFDFMSDTLYSGHRYRVLNIIDEGARQASPYTGG
jgi:putative transposase